MSHLGWLKIAPERKAGRAAIMRVSLSLLGLAVLTGCTSAGVGYQGLASAPELATAPKNMDQHLAVAYAAKNVDLTSYKSVTIDPVTIYTAGDQKFGTLSNADKVDLASYMQKCFGLALSKEFSVSAAASPTTLRVHLTLMGVEENTPVLSTLSRIVPARIVLDSGLSVADRHAPLMGSVSYAVEVFESTSNRLLRAYVAKDYPMAINILATFRTLDAARAGIRNGSTELLRRLNHQGAGAAG